jgi:uncharacterized protein (TIGR01244 family)
MTLRQLTRTAPLAALFVAFGIAIPNPLAAQPPAKPADVKAANAKPSQTKEKLEPYQCGKVERLHTLGDIFLASQPQKDDFKHAADNGIKTVVNLRNPKEIDWDEAKHVKQLGMEYHNLPFQSPKELNDELFEKARKLLTDKTKRPLLLHCSSANRVGAIWLAHRVLDDGVSYDDALTEAKTVGLKLPALEQKAKDYIQRQKK